MYSCQYGYLNIAKYLIRHGAKLDLVDTQGRTAIMFACERGHDEVVEYLMEEGADLDIKDNEGKTAAIISKENEFNEVENIIAEFKKKTYDISSDSDIQRQVDWKEIHLICRHGQLDKLKEIIEHPENMDADTDVNIYEKTEDGWSPLHIAAYFNQTEIVDCLLDNEYDVDMKCHGYTPLYFASRNGHQEMVELLIKRGSEIGELNSNGMTALHVACYYNHYSVVKILLKHGASFDIDEATEYELFQMAAKNKNLRMIHLLLEVGQFNINSKNEQGATFLHLSAKKNYYNIARNLIKDKYLDLNEVDQDFNTPLHKACEYGHACFVQLLLRYDAMVNFKNKWGFTPLHLACQHGQVAIVKLLLENGANVEAATQEQKVPLHFACETNNKTIAKILLNYGANINAKTFLSWTPLHYAVYHQYTNMVAMLFAYHPDILIRTNREQTVMDMAYASKSDHIFRLLQRYYLEQKGYPEKYEALLHEIKTGRQTNALNIIKSQKISLDYLDRHGWTALHWASYLGYTDIVEELILHEVNINERTREGLDEQDSLAGKKAKELAKLAGHEKIIQLLENRSRELKKEKIINTATPIVSTGISALSIAVA
jgi:ankyrin repeat protein